jgi:hypothetical protein
VVILVEIELNKLVRFVPSKATAVAIAMATPAARRPYSTAVTPRFDLIEKALQNIWEILFMISPSKSYQLFIWYRAVRTEKRSARGQPPLAVGRPLDAAKFSFFKSKSILSG